MIKTKILSPYQIDQAVELLKNGELVALPTETVYGLAADAFNENAVKKIFKAKERPVDHPLILHIDSFEKISRWAKNFSADVKKLAEAFWPGPLTIILNKQDNISNIITGGLDTIAIRIPNHPIILDIINRLGNGLVAPSANAHQKISPTNFLHVLKTLDGKIAGIIDGGSCSVGIESTIIDMTTDVPIILRPGSITQKMLESVLNIPVQNPTHHKKKVSGNMKNHYQPEKPLFLMTLEEIETISIKEKNIAIMHYSTIVKNENAFYYEMNKNKDEYAKKLYGTLHEIDNNTNIKKILVEMPPDSIDWNDIIDRLAKASTK